MKEELFKNIQTLSEFFYLKKKSLKEKIFEDLNIIFNKIDSTYNELQEKKSEIEKLNQFLKEERNKNVVLEKKINKLKNELNLFKDIFDFLEKKEIIKQIDDLKKIDKLLFLIEDIRDLMDLDEQNNILETFLNAMEEIIYNLKDMFYDFEEIEEFLELENENNIENIKDSFNFLSELFKELSELNIGNNVDDIMNNLKKYEIAYRYLNYLKKFDEVKLYEFEKFYYFTQDILKYKKAFNLLQKIKDLYENFDMQKIYEIEKEIITLNLDIKYIIDLIKYFIIVSKLLKKEKVIFEEIENEFEKLKSIVIKDVDIEFIEKIDLLKNKIIEGKLFEFKKNLKVGVGGGFSSGKTQFLQSIIGNSVELPIADTPTTAIATYFYYNQEISVSAYNILDTKVKIEPNEYNFLNHHQLLNNLNINYFVEFFMIQTPQKYKNLCFIEVPGYNAAKTSSTKNDFSIAKKYLNESDVILWLISIERGTLEKSDINFLKKFNKKFYVIINKADLRQEKEQEKILKEIKKILNENELEYEGISVFNSKEFEEMFYEKISLFHYLDILNKNTRINIKEQINTVFEDIENIFNVKIMNIQKQIKLLNEIEWDLMQYFYHSKEERRDIENKLEILESNHKEEIKKYQKKLKDMYFIKEKIKKIPL